jgi:DNA-binding TFAR19-related protein (PDSD5 family)
MKASVARCDRKEVHQEFERVLQQLTQLGHITDEVSQQFDQIELLFSFSKNFQKICHYAVYPTVLNWGNIC